MAHWCYRTVLQEQYFQCSFLTIDNFTYWRNYLLSCMRPFEEVTFLLAIKDGLSTGAHHKYSELVITSITLVIVPSRNNMMKSFIIQIRIVSDFLMQCEVKILQGRTTRTVQVDYCIRICYQCLHFVSAFVWTTISNDLPVIYTLSQTDPWNMLISINRSDVLNRKLPWYCQKTSFRDKTNSPGTYCTFSYHIRVFSFRENTALGVHKQKWPITCRQSIHTFLITLYQFFMVWGHSDLEKCPKNPVWEHWLTKPEYID